MIKKYCARVFSELASFAHPRRRKAQKVAQQFDAQSVSSKSSASTLVNHNPDLSPSPRSSLDNDSHRGLKRTVSNVTLVNKPDSSSILSGVYATRGDDAPRKRLRRDEERETSHPLPSTLSTPRKKASPPHRRRRSTSSHSSVPLASPRVVPTRSSCTPSVHSTASEPSPSMFKGIDTPSHVLPLPYSPPSPRYASPLSLNSSQSPATELAVNDAPSPAELSDSASIASSILDGPVPLQTTRTLAENGEATRIEIAFGKFYDELLRCSAHHETIERTSHRILETPGWTTVFDAYKFRVRRIRAATGLSAGLRKNRFMDLMNYIVEEAPRQGLGAEYRHDVRYGRYDEKGFQGHAPPISDEFATSRESSPSGSDIWEPWRDDRDSPCIGAIPDRSSPPSSAWSRAAVLIDVYNAGEEYKREPSLDSNPPSKRRHTETDLPETLPPPKRFKIRNTDAYDVQGSNIGHSSYSRLSWMTLEDDYYARPKPDDELRKAADLLFKDTGNRRHALGILVYHTTVKFYFMDRAGVVYSTPLDLRDPQDSVKILSAILSISFLDATQLGVEPYFAASSPSSEDFRSHDHGLLQRKEDLFLDVGGVSFHAEKLLYTEQMFGRGTVVWEAAPATPGADGHPIPSSNPSIPREVILKLSWQLPSMPREDEYLRLAQEKDIPGIVRLYASAVVGRLSDGPRARLVPSSMYADRELRVQVLGPRAMPIYRIKDLDTFKAAFRSLVVAHHELFKKTQILHRDISAGNLMVDRSNPRQGVLIDLDVAARVTINGDPVDGDQLPPAGTLQFRAGDLVIRERPTNAYYRHDLESFYFVLLWLQLHYKDGEPCQHPRASFGEFDFDLSWESTQDHRRGHFGPFANKSMPQVPLTETWLRPLHRMFTHGFDTEGLLDGIGNAFNGSDSDPATLGQQLSFEEFMRVLDR